MMINDARNGVRRWHPDPLEANDSMGSLHATTHRELTSAALGS